MRRILTAAVAVPLLYLYVARLSPAWFHGLVGVAGILALYEFYAMARVGRALMVSGLLAGAACLGAAALGGGFVPAAFLGAVVILMGVRLFGEGNPSGGLAETAVAAFGILYVPGLLGVQMALREVGVPWVLLLWISVWASDSLALYVGTWVGKRKLYPSMSPNKTVAGAVGSLVGGAAAATLMNTLYGFTSLPLAILLGLSLSVAAQIGDLVESMFKRDAGIKDSSGLIPGHGGLLDKLDAVLLAAPVLFVWVKGLQ